MVSYAFAYAAMKSEVAEGIERQLFKPTLVVIQGDNIANGDITFGEVLFDKDRLFSPDVVSNVGSEGVILFLLDGFPSILENQAAKEMKLDIASIAKTSSEHIVRESSVRLVGSWSIRPFRVIRRKIVFVDFTDLKNENRPECIAPLLYSYATDRHDKELSQSCRI
jgi:hypothetical protein